MAASIGDLEWLKQSLRDKQSYSDFDNNGLTVVHLAATHGRMECLRYLLEELQVSVDVASKHGWRPVHLCINSKLGPGAVRTLVYLMSRGAALSVANEDGTSPVHVAASEGHVACLKVLLQSSADFSSLDKMGNRPIDLAKLWSHRECAKLLATYGWHKQKNDQSRNLCVLEKTQIRAMLQRLEGELGLEGQDRFLGDRSFRRWLDEVVHKSKQKQVPDNVAKDQKLQKYYNDLEKRKKKRVSNTAPQHEQAYIVSMKSGSTFSPYQPDLEDLFPRHPLTLQPYPWSRPARLNPLTTEPLGQLLGASGSVVEAAARERTYTSISGVVDAATRAQNSMHYRSNSVLDLPRKKMVESAESFKMDDARFCFTNDVNSHMFRLAIGCPLRLSSANQEGLSPPSTASTNLSQYMAV